jgi:xylulokinase
MSIYLGVDVGTTAVKVIALDDQGTLLADASAGYPIAHPETGWAEQDAEDWWRCTCDCIARVTATLKEPVAALALSTQGDTMVPVDTLERPLAPARTWMDTRTLPQVRHMETLGAAAWYERTGAIPGCFCAAASLLWWREHMPEVFAEAQRFALVADFLVARLTGKPALDAPNASRTLLFNIHTRAWDNTLLDFVGVKPDRLCTVGESGTPVASVLPAVADVLGLSPETQVILGGHDQTCAALGCGVTRPGALMLSCGTAWVVLAATERPLADTTHSLHTYCHALPGGYVALGAFAGGNLLRWFRDNFCETSSCGDDAYQAITAAAAEAEQSAHSPLVFLPHFYGSQTPQPCPEARGAWIGLTLGHSRGDLALSVLRGVALQTAWAVQSIISQGAPVEEVRMIGGGARSAYWAQLVADALGQKVLLPEVREAAAYGAALLAAEGCGASQIFDDSTKIVDIREIVAPRAGQGWTTSPVPGQLFEKLLPFWGDTADK